MTADRPATFRRRLLAGLLVLALAVGLAVVPNLTFGTYNFIVKAGIHLGLYAVITLLGSALARWQRWPAWSGWLAALLVSALDEGLQHFSATRSASWGDWGFDLLGIIVGMVAGIAVWKRT